MGFMDVNNPEGTSGGTVTGFLRNDAPAREHETTAERYARQTRNAAVFVAVVIGLGVIISVIMGMAAIAAIHGISG